MELRPKRSRDVCRLSPAKAQRDDRLSAQKPFPSQREIVTQGVLHLKTNIRSRGT